MAEYVSKHSGLTIDSAIDRIIDGDVGTVVGVSVREIYQKVINFGGTGGENGIRMVLSDGTDVMFYFPNGTIPNFGVNNAGKVLYIDEKGEPNLITLSPALYIADGVLHLKSSVSGAVE